MPASATSAQATFGKYRLVAKLAIGGMAEIFLARFQGAAGFEKLVVIKRMLPSLAKDRQLVDMFLAEAKIAAQISHPNVCQVFELGELDGRYYIAMEYLEGVPLACFRRPDLYSAPPDARLVASLGIQAADGLHHAHNLKRPDGTLMEVVHRDVSANNLFATVDGVVKVLDFGIAKVQDASIRTTTGSVKGTYAYMAPEQLKGERIDRRADVFALGIVLWETLVRRHLFKRETDFLTFQAITVEPIPDVCELRPDVPPAFGEAIAKALSRDREARFPTTRALGEAIAKAVAPLGGPLTQGELSDEINRAFDSRLRDQRELIKLAREGGTLDLEEEIGRGVGHGTELMTTPLSVISGRSHVPEPAPATATVVAKGPEPRSTTLHVTPRPLAPRHGGIVRPLVIAGVVIGLAAAAFFVLHRGEPAPAAPVIAATPPPATPVATPPVPATPTHAPVAIVTPPTLDAGVVAAPPPPVVAPPGHPPAKPPVKPVAVAGPPGFITIDSAPVYATIFIDGRNLGETPLIHIELPPGKHALRAVSPSGSTHTLSITIQSGKVTPAARIEW